MTDGSGIISTQVIEIENCNDNIIERLVEQGDVTAIEQAVEACPDLLDWKCERTKETALHVACDVGDHVVAACLIRLGFSKISRDRNQFTPLMTSSRQGHLACARLLVENQKHIEVHDKNGWTPLLWAAYKGRTDVAAFLIERGAKIDVTATFNMTSLQWASARGFYEIAKMLCRKGAKVNQRDSFGNTSLLLCARKGYVEITKLLLEYKADQNTIGANGVTSLMTAIKGKYVECAMAILNCPNTNVNQASREGHTAISHACRHGLVDVVEKLIDRGAFVNTPDDEMDTPLMKAVKHGHTETVKLMLLRFAEVDTKNRTGKTALHLAVENGNFENVRALLNCNANVEAFDPYHQTPLFLAVKLKQYKIAKLLVEQGANITTTDKYGDLAIHLAMRQRSLPMVELLLHEPKNACTLYFVNGKGESAYEIDKKNETNILSQLFGTSSKSFAYNDRFDVYNHCLAEMLTEPGFQTPICVALYAKCRSGLSFVLDNFKRQVSLYRPLVWRVHLKKILWITYFLVAYIPLMFGLLGGIFAREPVLVVLLTTFFLFSSFYLFIVFINYERAKIRWSWVEKCSSFFHSKQSYLLLLFKILFMKYYERESQRNGMRFVVVGPLNILNVDKQSLEFHFSSSVVKSVEKHVGKIAFRLARAMNKSGVIQSHPGETRHWRFRRMCCLPSIIWLVLFIITKISVLVLLVAYRPHQRPAVEVDEEDTSFNAMPLLYMFVGCSGFVILLSIPHISRLMISCFDSPSRQHRKGMKAAAKGKFSKYLHQQGSNNRSIRELCSSVQALDAIQGFNTRIFLLVDGLETTDGEKVLQCVETIHSCFNREMIVSILCTDFHLLSSAANSNFLRPSTNLNLNGSEYLQNTIQLPIFLAEHVRRKRAKDLKESDYNIKQLHLNIKIQRMKQFDALRQMSLRCEILNPKLMKRIMSLLMITARMMRVNDESFTWESLFSWVIMCELWPFTSVCLYSYHLSKRKKGDMELTTLHDEIRDQLAPGNEYNHASHSAFVEFITNSKFKLLTSQMELYYKFSVNIDPRITSYLPSFIDINNPCSSEAVSERSNVFVPSSNRNDIRDWTIDDVCAKIRTLPGLDPRNLTNYERFIRVNNFHGSAVASCDLDELKKELKTSFGDWCLLRRFILHEKEQQGKKPSIKELSITFSESESDVHSVDETSRGTSTTLSPATAAAVELNEHEHSVIFTSSASTDPAGAKSLATDERLAYNAAFKDYLRLQQQQTSDSNSSNRTTTTAITITEDSSPVSVNNNNDNDELDDDEKRHLLSSFGERSDDRMNGNV